MNASDTPPLTRNRKRKKEAAMATSRSRPSTPLSWEELAGPHPIRDSPLSPDTDTTPVSGGEGVSGLDGGSRAGPHMLDSPESPDPDTTPGPGEEGGKAQDGGPHPAPRVCVAPEMSPATTPGTSSGMSTRQSGGSESARTSPPLSPASSDVESVQAGPKPPPIFLEKVAKWRPFLAEVTARARRPFVAKVHPNGSASLRMSTPEDYRAICRLVEGTPDLKGHWYPLKEDRERRIVIQGIPLGIGGAEVAQELTEQGVCAPEHLLSVRRLKNKEGRETTSVVVSLPFKAETKGVYHIQTLFSCKVEARAWTAGRPVQQCFRCQRVGHASRHCSHTPRCVKCAGTHEAASCPKGKDEPPKCVNCSGAHSANYRGCPKLKKVVVSTPVGRHASFAAAVRGGAPPPERVEAGPGTSAEQRPTVEDSPRAEAPVPAPSRPGQKPEKKRRRRRRGGRRKVKAQPAPQLAVAPCPPATAEPNSSVQQGTQPEQGRGEEIVTANSGASKKGGKRKGRRVPKPATTLSPPETSSPVVASSLAPVSPATTVQPVATPVGPEEANNPPSSPLSGITVAEVLAFMVSLLPKLLTAESWREGVAAALTAVGEFLARHG
jgi:hypothetical protein